jgi:cysteine desulfurase
MRAYFDHNATCPLKPVAKEAMLAALQQGNPSSVHWEGRAARAIVENAREVLARCLGVLPPMIVFTSGGTEANNLAIRGSPVERLIVSSVEHPSVIEAARARRLTLEIVPVDGMGVVDLDALDALLGKSPLPTLVSVMLANNETGVIQPVGRVSQICGAHNALIHTDAVQALGKIPVRFPELGADLLTVSSHKLGGPMGVGALVARAGLTLSPQMSGGGQELRRRAGTENVVAIAGFAAVLEDKIIEIRELRDQLEKRLEALSPQVVVFARHAGRLPNTSCFALAGLAADTVLISLDLDGVAVSTGSACSSGKVARSHVLDAMGIEPGLASAAIRASLGWNTTQADVDKFIAAWRRIIERTNRIAA